MNVIERKEAGGIVSDTFFINGSCYADNSMDFQDSKIVPRHASSVASAIRIAVANSIPIKPNQVGTITEAMDCLAEASAQ